MNEAVGVRDRVGEQPPCIVECCVHYVFIACLFAQQPGFELGYGSQDFAARVVLWGIPACIPACRSGLGPAMPSATRGATTLQCPT